MAVNFGTQRVTPGAHFGTRDWLAQRITATLLTLFTLLVIAAVVFSSGPIGYESWAAIFAPQWMKALTLAVFVSLGYHVWVGMRNIWMDYVKPPGIRLGLHVFTIVWLVACMGWAVQVLWRI